MTIKIKFSPVRSEGKLSYTIVDDFVTVTHLTVVEPIKDELGEQIPQVKIDTFDFSKFPDGEAKIEEIETTLPINPFISVKRVNGVLELEVINFIGKNASEEDKFPTELEVEKYPLVREVTEGETIEEGVTE